MIRIVLLAILLLIPRISKASEVLEEGTVLEEKSLVFTMEEADKLKNTIFELEKKEEMLAEYIDLCSIKDSKIELYKINEDLYKSQIDKYKDIVSYQDEQINNYRKIQSASKYKEVGIFTLGVAVTVASILLADKLNDSINWY